MSHLTDKKHIFQTKEGFKRFNFIKIEICHFCNSCNFHKTANEKVIVTIKLYFYFNILFFIFLQFCNISYHYLKLF